MVGVVSSAPDEQDVHPRWSRTAKTQVPDLTPQARNIRTTETKVNLLYRLCDCKRLGGRRLTLGTPESTEE